MAKSAFYMGKSSLTTQRKVTHVPSHHDYQPNPRTLQEFNNMPAFSLPQGSLNFPPIIVEHSSQSFSVSLKCLPKSFTSVSFFIAILTRTASLCSI